MTTVMPTTTGTGGTLPPQTNSPVDRLKATLRLPSVEEQFKNALAEGSNLFVASLIDLYGGDNYLQKCNPKDVIMEALKAATLRLPINKSLGFAYIVPYKNRQGVLVPTFQLGYRGEIQLAMRTGQYRYINADVVYEGEFKKAEKLTGNIDLSGERTSDTVIGYFAYFETLNGFCKTVYITKDDVTAHAKKYSASFGSSSSPWKTDFDAMAIKTCLRKLLGKYGIMSVEMQKAYVSESFDGGGAPPFAGPNQGPIIDIGDEGGNSGQATNGNGQAKQPEGPGF